MDKRTLLFVLLVSAAFFGVNIYFSSSRDKQERQKQEEQGRVASVQRQERERQANEKRVPLSDLPLVKITSDYQGKNLLGWGVNVEGAILTLAWSRDLPEKIYVAGEEKQLQTRDFSQESLVLFIPKNFEQLEVAAVPKSGISDLQLVSFPPGAAPEITFGQYEENNLSLPLGPICCNAIALFKTERGYLPLGFYSKVGGIFIELQNYPLFSALPLHRTEIQEAAPSVRAGYYVLENEWLQLVFTTTGGALAEINLPFESKKDSKSVVKQIGFDRKMVEKAPNNARFPSHPYYTYDNRNEPREGVLGGYYPLLRRTLMLQAEIAIPAEHSCCNLVSDYPEMATLNYQVKEFTQDKIVFEGVLPYRRITKTYSLKSGAVPYTFDLAVKIEGDARSLFLTSGVPEVEIISNASSPQIQFRITRKNKGDVEKLDLPKVGELITMSSGPPDWVANSNGYLGTLITPLHEPKANDLNSGFRARAIDGARVPTRLAAINQGSSRFSLDRYPGFEVLMPLSSRTNEYSYRVYAGPFEEKTLQEVDSYFEKSTGKNPDYRAAWTFYGWLSFITEPLAKFLFIFLKFFYSITHSWGFSIILLTVFLRLVLYPLNAWSLKSMQRMREISPEVQAIQKKYKKEPKKAQMEVMALYREKKINPMSGCFPLLIQLPFLIAMFDLLKSSFQLRGASFIPGWIDDLTAPDVLFSWERPIFFIGNEFHLMPIILGVVMLLQQRLSSPLPKDRPPTDQERQQRAMGTMMAVVFTVMFYNFPSGLNLYWLSSMLLGMGQQWLSTQFTAKKGRLGSKKLGKEKSR